MTTNPTANLPLPLQVWLAHDIYDYSIDANTFSATALLKPIQALVLERRYPEEGTRQTNVRASIGTAIHSAIEAAWKDPERLKSALVQLGYPKSKADKVAINPENQDDCFPVYMEQRECKEIAGYKVSGKYDFIIDGVLHDFKTTSTAAYTYGSRDKDHALQGSIYRWLNPTKITEDYIRICYVFLDWKPSYTNNSDYPSDAAIYKDIPLLDVQETQRWIKQKLLAYDKAKQLPDPNLPRCSDEELWIDPPVFKYYSNPEKRERATKNFTSLVDANTYMASKGGKGIVITTQGTPKRCAYCNAREHCNQAKEYFNENS